MILLNECDQYIYILTLRKQLIFNTKSDCDQINKRTGRNKKVLVGKIWKFNKRTGYYYFGLQSRKTKEAELKLRRKEKNLRTSIGLDFSQLR